jgi:hypothetical protein
MYYFLAKAYSNIALAVLIETAMKIKCTIFWLKHIAIALAVLIETAMKIKCTIFYYALAITEPRNVHVFYYALVIAYYLDNTDFDKSKVNKV